MSWLRRNWRWAAPAGVAVAGLGAWLFFGWFGFHTLFFDRTVDEAPPEFTTVATTTTTPTTTAVTSAPESTTSSTTTTAIAGPLYSGVFVDRSHGTTGMAIVLGDGAGQRVLRLEEFETANGPDLFVYLSAAPVDSPAGAFDDDYVDLGTLKGNIGDQNYDIPVDVDLDHYSTVVIWCRRFTVVFGAAALG